MKIKKHSSQLPLQWELPPAKHSVPSTWCVYCNTNLRKDRAVVIRHLRDNHGNIIVDETLIAIVMDNSSHRRLTHESSDIVGSQKVSAVEVAKPKKKKVKNKTGKSVSRLRLISKRSTRLYSLGACDNCGKNSSTRWRYAESNRGAVNICSTCKPALQNYSYGNVDALAVSHIGGGWAPKSQRKR